MKRIWLAFLFIIFGALFFSCATIRDNFLKDMREKEDAQHARFLLTRTFPENINAILDIPYIDSDHRGHKLDIYYPSNMEGPFPVVINIHGGGFVYDNKENNKLYCYKIAEKGFIVFNINYRLAAEDVRVPGQIPDVINALDWIGNNMKHYPSVPDKVYVVGHSAGGYLTAITALISESERLQNVFKVKKPNIKINAVAINCGYFEMARKNIKWWGMRWAVYEKGYKKQEYYKNMILKNLPEMSSFPPAFVISNVDDKHLSFMSFYLVDLLKKNNRDYYFYYLQRGDRKLRHCFDVFNPDRKESGMIRDKMLEYFLMH